MSDDKYWVVRVSPSWGSSFDSYYVEIAKDFEATSACQLGTKYKDLGEGEGYANPREAALAGARVARQWAKDEGEPIGLAWQTRHGGYYGMPGEDVSIIQLFLLAKEELESLAKCDWCREILTGEVYKYEDLYEAEFCSTNCGEQAIEWAMEDVHE